MSSKYQIEVLLRPPIEFYTSVAAFLSILFLVKVGHLLLIPTQTIWGASLCIGLYGGKRFLEGWRVLSYQRCLKRSPKYTAGSKDIPVRGDQHFIGRGFTWSETHTQRIYDLRDADNRHYLEESTSYRLAQSLFLTLQRFQWLSHVNLFQPNPQLGGAFYLQGVGIQAERDTFIPTSVRKGHMMYLGSTQTGKTRALEINLIQDIARKNPQGDFHNVVIIIDPKGDADLLKRAYLEAKRNGRLEDFQVFHLGSPENSVRYNPIGSFSRVTEVASRIAGQLPNSGNSSAFKEFAWQFVNIITNALIALGVTPNYREIQRYIRNIDPLFIRYASNLLNLDDPDNLNALPEPSRGIKQQFANRDPLVAILIDHFQTTEFDDFILESLLYAVRMEKQYFDKITIQVAPFLEKLLTGNTSEILSPDLKNTEDTRPLLDWEKVIRRRGIVYVGLDALTDPEVASVVGESMFADLTSLAGRIYKSGVYPDIAGIPTPAPPKITIHADEFSDLVGNRFASLANKAGAAGVELVLYSQTLSDLNARLGDSAKSGQIIGNINSIVMLRVKERQTAELITEILPKIKVHRLTAVSGVTDAQGAGASMDFTSSNQDRISEELVPMIEPGDICALPNGQAFSLTQGNQLHKLRLPLPEPDEETLPRYLSELMKTMRSHYRSEINLSQFREPSHESIPAHTG